MAAFPNSFFHWNRPEIRADLRLRLITACCNRIGEPRRRLSKQLDKD